MRRAEYITDVGWDWKGQSCPGHSDTYLMYILGLDIRAVSDTYPHKQARL